MPLTIQDLRKHRGYDEYTDEQLGDMVFNKYYADQPELRSKFNEKFYPKPVEAPQEEFEDNKGPLSYFEDIIDRGKAIDESIELFNQLRETDETSPEFKTLTEKFRRANEKVNYYTEEDNWFLGLGKSIATDTLAILGAGIGGSLVGGAGGPLAAGTVGFERSRRQQQVFNAYRELESSGDLTAEELDGAANTAILQAAGEGLIDAATAGVFSGVAKGALKGAVKQETKRSLLKNLAATAAVGGVQEVGSAMLQRGYVSNLEVFGDGSLNEYLENFAAGAVAQGILGAGFAYVNSGKSTDTPLNEDELLEMKRDGFLDKVVEDFATAKTENDVKSLIDAVVSNPNYFRLKHQQEKLQRVLAAEKQLTSEKDTKKIEKLKKVVEKKDSILKKIDEYTPTPEQQDAAGTADLFENTQIDNVEVQRPKYKLKKLNQSPPVSTVFKGFETRTDLPYYDDGIQNQEYYRDKKKVDIDLVEMSPDEYMNKVKSGNKLIGELSDGVDEKRVNDYAKKMLSGEKFPALTLDYRDGKFTQEGRHRALAAKKAGILKVPVVVAKTVSKTPNGFDKYSIVSKKPKYITDTDGKKHKIEDIDDSVANIIVHKKTGDIVVDDVLKQDALHEVFSFAAQENRQVRSKSKMDKSEFDKWSDYVRKNPDILFEVNTPIVEKDGSYKSENGKPLFKTKEVPEIIKQAYETKITNKSKAKQKPIERDGFFRKNSEAQKIESNLTRLFEGSPVSQFTIQSMSDKALLEFAKSAEYKRLFGPKNSVETKLMSKRIAEAADEHTTEASELMKSDVHPSAINTNTLGGLIAERYHTIARNTADPRALAKQFGDKTSQRAVEKNTILDIFNLPFFQKYARSAQALAREYPQIAEIMSFGRYRQNFTDGVSKAMEFEGKALHKALKEKGALESSYKLLEMADTRGLKYDNTTKTYEGMTVEQSRNVKALSDYHQRPMLTARITLGVSRQNAEKAGDQFLVAQLDKEIKRIDQFLEQPYFPRRRFGDLLFQINGSTYGLESVKGVDAAIPGIHKINENVKVMKEDWEKLRERIKREHNGEDIGDSPQKFFVERLPEGDVANKTLFVKNMKKINNGALSDFLQNENFLQLLNDADKNKLEYFRQYSGADTLGQLLTRKKNVPGWSDDYERLMVDSYKTGAASWSNYIFEQPMRKLASEYLTGDPKTIAQEYAHQVFGKDNNVSDTLARVQAFLALGGNLSTAALQLTSFWTTVPMVMSAVSQNPTTMMKFLRSPQSFKLFAERLKNAKLAADYDSLKRIGGKDYADFVISRTRTISNNPSDDFTQSSSNKRWLSKGLNKFEDFAHSAMMAAEEATRLQSSYAIFNMLKDPKNLAFAKQKLKNDQRVQELLNNRGDIPEHYILTEVLMDNAFGVYGKLGWAGVQANNIGRVALPFISYPLQMTELMIDHMKGTRGKEGVASAMVMIGSMPLMFGIAGMPFYDLLELLYAQLTGMTGGVKRKMDDDIFNTLYEIDPDAALFLKRGTVGSMFNVDVSRRVALGNPWSSITRMFNESGPVGRDVGFILPRIADIKSAVETGDGVEMIKSVSPISIQNVIKAALEYPEKGVMTKSGEIILPADQLEAADSLKKILGFNPTNVSNAQTAFYSAVSQQNQYTGPKKRQLRNAYPYYKKWIESGKEDENARLRVIELFNEYRDMYLDNNDIFTSDKASGFFKSLHETYMNEMSGFPGRQSKSNFNPQVQQRTIEMYDKLKGNGE